MRDIIICDFFKHSCYTVTFSRTPEVAVNNNTFTFPPISDLRDAIIISYLLFFFPHFPLSTLFCATVICIAPAIVSLPHLRITTDVSSHGVLLLYSNLKWKINLKKKKGSVPVRLYQSNKAKAHQEVQRAFLNWPQLLPLICTFPGLPVYWSVIGK